MIYRLVPFPTTFRDPLTSISRSQCYYRPRCRERIVCAADARSVCYSWVIV